MYGLQDAVSFDPLVGQTVIQVCVGENEVILHFSDECRITIFGDVEVVDERGNITFFNAPMSLGLALISFLGRRITRYDILTKGTLCIHWDTARRLTLFDSFPQFESYVIVMGETSIVV